MYVIVKNNKVIKHTHRPNWRIGETQEDSRPLTDLELIEHGVYPVQEIPEYNQDVYRLEHIPMPQWEINSRDVGPIYRLVELTPAELQERFEQKKIDRLDSLREKRWQVETGGVSVGGMIVQSDEISQGKITGAINLFSNDPSLLKIDWEAQPGVWVEIDKATMTSIGVAVGRHIQACFSHAKALSEAIMAAEDDVSLEAVDIHSGWPGQE